MTTSEDVLSLFDIHPDTPRIVGYGWNASVARMLGSYPDVLAVCAILLDPKTKDASDKWLFLQLQRDDAMILAKAILKVAKERNWPEPDAEIVQTRLADDESIH